VIILFTDFGWNGPYVGLMKGVLQSSAPAIPIVDLLHDAPTFNPKASAYLLAALVKGFPPDSIFLCVVDPGVGDPERRPVVVKADGRWFVGPDNGLFNVLANEAKDLQWWDITWKPEKLSSTFHGRDLFAPIAARIAQQNLAGLIEQDAQKRILPDWSQQLAEIVYSDHYGNCMTGLQVESMCAECEIEIGKNTLSRAQTFSEVPQGRAFWFENAIGLVEIAINKGNAQEMLGINVGDAVEVVS